jgi:hypothetical protein
MSSLIYSTFADLARRINLDRRHPALREIEPDAFLRFGNRIIPIFAESKNGTQVSTNSTGTSIKE